MSRISNRMDRIFSSAPLNATAGAVTGAGDHFNDAPPSVFNGYHSDTPPQTFPVPRQTLMTLGQRCGRFTVVGYAGSHSSGGAMWAVRCVCGMYEKRKTKPLLNPANAEDACYRCKKLAYLKRSEKFLLTKEGKEWSLTKATPLLGAKP